MEKIMLFCIKFYMLSKNVWLLNKSGQPYYNVYKWRNSIIYSKTLAGFKIMINDEWRKIGLKQAARNIISAWANCGKQPTIEAILNSVADLLYVAKTIKLGLG